MIKSSDLQQKYAFLLQPIRDLTKNFEVDLYHVLEEYIEDLEKMEFTLEDGKTINFVEAAMLIQGTVHVWGRKVEYLHGLVGQTLNMLANRKSAPDKEQGDDAVNAKESEDMFEEDDDVRFLSLNDEKGTNNRLPKSHDCKVKPLPTAATLALEIENSNRGTTLERQSENDNIYHVQDFVAVCATSYNDSIAMLQADTDAHSFYAMKTTPLSILRKTQPQVLPEVQDTIDLPPADELPMEPDLPDIDENNNDDIYMNDSVHEEECTVHIQGMNLRSQTPNIANKSEEIEEIVLLDEHAISHEYSSKPFYKTKSILSTKVTKKPGTFMQFLFNLDIKNSKHGNDLNHWLESFIKENNSHVKRFAELRKQIRKEMKDLKTDKNDVELPEIPNNQVVDNEDMFDDHNDDDCFDNDFSDNLGIIQENQEKEEDEEEVPISYEDLVQQNVQKFYQEALRFKQDNELAKRVKQWEERVVPLLKEQNSRPEFDIHECGDKMVSKFTASGDVKLFVDCVKECTKDWEICRLFAATLQLANDGNFLISKKDTTNSMTLELLTNKRSRDRLENYDGPPLQL